MTSSKHTAPGRKLRVFQLLHSLVLIAGLTMVGNAHAEEAAEAHDSSSHLTLGFTYSATPTGMTPELQVGVSKYQPKTDLPADKSVFALSPEELIWRPQNSSGPQYSAIPYQGSLLYIPLGDANEHSFSVTPGSSFFLILSDEDISITAIPSTKNTIIKDVGNGMLHITIDNFFDGSMTADIGITDTQGNTQTQRVNLLTPSKNETFLFSYSVVIIDEWLKIHEPDLPPFRREKSTYKKATKTPLVIKLNSGAIGKIVLGAEKTFAIDPSKYSYDPDWLDSKDFDFKFYCHRAAPILEPLPRDGSIGEIFPGENINSENVFSYVVDIVDEHKELASKYLDCDSEYSFHKLPLEEDPEKSHIHKESVGCFIDTIESTKKTIDTKATKDITSSEEKLLEEISEYESCVDDHKNDDTSKELSAQISCINKLFEEAQITVSEEIDNGGCFGDGPGRIPFEDQALELNTMQLRAKDATYRFEVIQSQAD